MSDSVRPHRRQPTRLLCPWDSPGKNTGVGCHVLLQCRKVKNESETAQLCPTLCDPMDCSPPGSSVHGIFQARVLEWGAVAFSKGKDIGSEPTALPNFGAGANHQPPFCFFFFHPSFSSPSILLLSLLSSCYKKCWPNKTTYFFQVSGMDALEFCLFLSQRHGYREGLDVLLVSFQQWASWNRKVMAETTTDPRTSRWHASFHDFQSASGYHCV